MSEDKRSVIKDMGRYFCVFCRQVKVNGEYLGFLILGTIADIGLIEAFRVEAWIAILVVNLLFGLLAIGTIVRPVDKAFQSLGLDYTKGYGSPHWLVDGKYPLQQDIIRINSAGYGPADYEKYIGHLASRLKQPIRDIRKPSATESILEVVLKRSHLPATLSYQECPIGDLKSGEFILGKRDEGFEKLSLKEMIHMLVAGQTGSGKTQFLRQFMGTVLTQTWDSYVALIDMKGGIDFQAFMGVPNFQLVTTYREAESVLSDVIRLFELRKAYLLKKRKTNWADVSSKDLESDEAMNRYPLGPVIVVVDELAELAKKATERSAKSPLQEKLATLARLARFTGIHLVLGTQRPDKGTLDMQSKDNLPTRVCFSVPSISASTLVIGDMSASTLGNIPGRAIYQRSGNKVIQTPLIESSFLEEMLVKHTDRLKSLGYSRRLEEGGQMLQPSMQEVQTV